jgi:hypothetical protein
MGIGTGDAMKPSILKKGGDMYFAFNTKTNTGIFAVHWELCHSIDQTETFRVKY